MACGKVSKAGAASEGQGQDPVSTISKEEKVMLCIELNHADPATLQGKDAERAQAACIKRARKAKKRLQDFQNTCLGKIESNRRMGRHWLDHVPPAPLLTWMNVELVYLPQ